MPYSAEDWPIAAALLPFPATLGDGTLVQDAGGEHWLRTLGEVAEAGFSNVDITDSWIRPGDLSNPRLRELKQAATDAGLGTPSLSAIRRSVIDAHDGEENLAYSHRTLDAAAELGVEVVSFGLHQALTPEQRKQLWFWTVEGYKDPVDDPETWNTAVSRLRELGSHAAELGLLVSLELYEDTYLGTADSSVRLVEEIGLHNLGLNPDVGNLIRLHRPIEDWRYVMSKVLPYANFWHIKNYSRDEDLARNYFVAVPAPLETGLISYRDAVRDAISLGFQGIFCTEHYGGDGLSVSASNQEYLRQRILPKTSDYPPVRSLVAQSRVEVDPSSNRLATATGDVSAAPASVQDSIA